MKFVIQIVLLSSDYFFTPSDLLIEQYDLQHRVLTLNATQWYSVLLLLLQARRSVLTALRINALCYAGSWDTIHSGSIVTRQCCYTEACCVHELRHRLPRRK